MIVVGVRGNERNRDEGREKMRLKEVRVFPGLGFEREKNIWRVFLFEF